MRILFDDQAINDRYAGLTTFKDCLFESFSHILQTGRTSPSLLRLMEAAFAFSMREEKLQRYPEEEWQLLCRAAAVLRPEDELCSVLYLDKLMTQNDGDKGLEIAKIFTFDTLNTVTAGIDFAKYIVDKHISTKVLCSLGVFCLSTQNKVLSLTSHILR